MKNISINDLINEYRNLQKISVDTKIYLFFDEITNQSNFRQQLKNLYDRVNCKIIASSSSTSALRDQKGWLTGREIKQRHPRYIYQNGIELDFLTEDNVLIEVKYGQELNTKQQQLFNDFKCKQKLVINGLQDLDKLA